MIGRLFTAAMFGGAICIALGIGLAVYGADHVVRFVRGTGAAARSRHQGTGGNAASPRGGAARALSETGRRDEALRREALSDWRRTTYPPGGADA